MSTSRPEHLTIGKFAQPGGLGQSFSNPASASTSPNEPTSGGSTIRSPFGLPTTSGLGSSAKMASTRSGAGSPSHDPLAAPGSARFLPSKRYVNGNNPSHLWHSQMLTCSLSSEPAKFKHKKVSPAYLSTPGAAHPPVETRHPYVRTSQSLPQMGFPNSRNCQVRRVSHQHAALVLARFPPGSLPMVPPPTVC